MSGTKTITLVQVACETPRDYRAVKNLCIGYPHKASWLIHEGWIRVHDAEWFAQMLSACNGRVIEERIEVRS